MKTSARNLPKGLGLVAPLLIASILATASQGSPSATRLWSVGPLTKSEPVMGISFGANGPTTTAPHVDSQTSSTFAATRSIAFVGDRIVIASMLGMEKSEGAKVPRLVYKLLSLDVKSGAVKDTREILVYASLEIFEADEGHVIVSGQKLFRLTPDLKDDGSLDVKGNVHNISPDGSTLGNATYPGFQSIDARTFRTTPVTADAGVDRSVNRKGYLTNNVFWTGEYPEESGFVTYVDASGQHLLYHGKCGGMPDFLTDELFLETGCKNPLIIDLHGNLIRTLSPKGRSSYAGVSQDGKRFALQVRNSSNSERFVIYSLDTGEPLVEVAPKEKADEQSWTAFSPDGSLFVVGSPLKLTLYRLP